MWRLMIVLMSLPLASLNDVDDLLSSVEKVGDAYLIEGDMLMSKEQITAVAHGKNPGEISHHAFGLNSRDNLRWPGAIVPYKLSDIFKSSVPGQMSRAETIIRGAMKEWEQKTCIRFVERTTERDYIEFVNGGFGRCASLLGRAGGKQKLLLGPYCLKHGIVVHELGHVLGFYHEQSRPDRDQYVEILKDNIISIYAYNFKKYSHGRIDSLGSPYDYGSIMHYPADAFAKSRDLVTIRPKKKGVKIGQRDHLSVEDARQINAYYQCSRKG